MPLEVIDFQTEMIITLAKDFDWEHYINKFDEYESRKNNQKIQRTYQYHKKPIYSSIKTRAKHTNLPTDKQANQTFTLKGP